MKYIFEQSCWDIDELIEILKELKQAGYDLVHINTSDELEAVFNSNED